MSGAASGIGRRSSASVGFHRRRRPAAGCCTRPGGDPWASIAARFGESEDDVEWMYPIRIPGNERMAYARQVLNLDPENRGDSGSRRPQ
jgi:hypothetical protein